MAYAYKKLADVTLVESATMPNLLIEEDGDIKKISASNLVTPQTKVDWEETDPNSSAYILNKPDLSQTGGANVVTYTIESSALKLNGAPVNRQTVLDEWNNGSILRINETNSIAGDSLGSLGTISNIQYTISGGTLTGATIYYYSSGTLSSLAI